MKVVTNVVMVRRYVQRLWHTRSRRMIGSDSSGSDHSGQVVWEWQRVPSMTIADIVIAARMRGQTASKMLRSKGVERPVL